MTIRTYRRRAVVRTAGVLTVGAVAGCLDDGESETGSSEEQDGESGTTNDADAGEDDTETGGDEDRGGNDTDDADGGETRDDDSRGADDSGDASEDGIEAGDPPEGFAPYINDGQGYSIAYPQEWDVDGAGEEIYITDPDGGQELGIVTFEASDSPEALAAEFLAGFEADYEDVEVREETDRVLESGQDARLLDVAYTAPDGDRGRRRSRMLFATDRDADAGYVVEVAASAEAFDDAFEDRADVVLDSFRIEGGRTN